MSARTISIFVPPVSVRVFTQPGSFSEVRPHSRRVRFAPTNGHRRLDRLGQKSAMNGRCRRAYIVTQAALVGAPALARQRLGLRYFQRERLEWRWPGPLCGPVPLPTTRPTLYAEWTDIELVRELSLGRAEVPVSYWQRRCCRQASHFNRPTVFLAGAFSHSQSHGRAIQHDLFAVREKRHEDSLFSDIGDAGGLRTRCSRG